MKAEPWIDLTCHRSTRTGAVRGVRVQARRPAGAELHLTFRLDGDLRRIRLPSAAAPRIAADLWRHTCFEVFIAEPHQQRYHEVNLAPSGEWAVRAFRGYRDGALLMDEKLRPEIAERRSDSRLELDTVVRLDRLSDGYPGSALRVGLSAVIEAQDGLSYWALRHMAERPDFHDTAGFSVLLDPS